jgi:hypothetical protein
MWSIVELKRHTSDGLVITAHWEAVKESNGKRARVYGSIGLPMKDPSDLSFIPFDELTEEVVLSWVHAALGAEQVAAYEANLDAQLDALINPPILSGTPWNAEEVIDEA